MLWAGYLGFLPLLKRKPALALPLLPPLLLMTYVNMCSGDWWAGGSFSNRRFDSLLPDAGPRHRGQRSRPSAAWSAEGPSSPSRASPFPSWCGTARSSSRCAAASCPATTPWTARGSWATRPRSCRTRWGFPPPGPRAGSSRAQHGALSRAVRPPRGPLSLLPLQNNLKGRIGIGDDDDAPMLGEGWGRPVTTDGIGLSRHPGSRAGAGSPGRARRTSRCACAPRPRVSPCRWRSS